MEHVCFSRNLSIIDCIEFNDRFRYSDTVADIAFLLMDLEYQGGKDSSALLWKYYGDFAGEDEAVARAGLDDLARAPARAFMANERRRSDLLVPVLRIDPAFAATPGYRVAAVKALMTLLGNWRRPLGDLATTGSLPSAVQQLSRFLPDS
jgi:hypothetical protein